MARITLASQALVIADQAARIAALEARLAIATTVYRNQRTTIRELESALNTRGVKPTITSPVVQAPQPKAIPTPTTSTYRDASGQLWERTRYSAARAVSRKVDEPAFVSPTFVSCEDSADRFEHVEFTFDA